MMQEFIRYCDVEHEFSSVGESYGMETFCWFFYSLIRMECPNVIVEVGSGAGVTTIAAALALNQNGRGTLWSVDDGADWTHIRKYSQAALGYYDESESYPRFRARLAEHFRVEDHVRMIAATVSGGAYFSPESDVDLVFIDAGNTTASGCIEILKYYLPKMSAYSSICIDASSIIWDSYLLLELVVGVLNDGRIPGSLLAGQR